MLSRKQLSSIQFRSTWFALALAALALLTPLNDAVATAATTISPPEQQLFIPPGGADASLWLKIHVEGTGADKAPDVVDLGMAGFPLVKVEANPKSVSTGPSAYDWFFQLTLSKIPPKLTQTRQVKVVAGGMSQTLSYVLSNQSFAWTIKPTSTTWQVRGLTGRTFQVGAVEGPATKVRIAFCRLEGREPFDCSHLQLCDRRLPDHCGPELNLPPNQSSLYLRLDDKFRQPGSYRGTVYLTADTRTDAEALSVDLSYTSWIWQLFGVFCIAAGVVLGWLLTVYSRNRIARDRALFAVAALGETSRNLQRELNRLPSQLAGNVTGTKTAVADVLSSLAPSKLDRHGYLPTVLGGVGDTAAYQAFLTATGERVSMLKVIVDGMLAALKIPESPTLNDPRPHDRVLSSLDGLDAAIQPPSADAARLQVKTLLATLVPAPKGLVAGMDAASPPPTAESLRLDIERISWAGWLAWLLITVIVGYLAQVDKPGFGTTVDLVVCLLWGIGLPAAGTQLSQLTPSSVATTLKIPVP